MQGNTATAKQKVPAVPGLVVVDVNSSAFKEVAAKLRAAGLPEGKQLQMIDMTHIVLRDGGATA